MGQKYKIMLMYEPKNFENLFGMPGFSDEMLTNHFTLYQGYVKNVNKVSETLTQMLGDGKTANPEYAELKRRFGWEFNVMRLHELYFANMTNEAGSLSENSSIMKKISEVYNSYDNWERDFKAVGAMRGIGWAILYHDKFADRLFNVWINEHEFGHLAGGNPILVLDVFEHAYITDYGLKRADYIEAFFKAIDWEVAENRMKQQFAI